MVDTLIIMQKGLGGFSLTSSWNLGLAPYIAEVLLCHGPQFHFSLICFSSFLFRVEIYKMNYNRTKLNNFGVLKDNSIILIFTH